MNATNTDSGAIRQPALEGDVEPFEDRLTVPPSLLALVDEVIE